MGASFSPCSTKLQSVSTSGPISEERRQQRRDHDQELPCGDTAVNVQEVVPLRALLHSSSERANHHMLSGRFEAMSIGVPSHVLF